MPQTGATRHQKFLKSEKSKTKLKSKKKDLPKGTNVTKTNFKVKKIVIKEQLKKHGKSEALSTRKLNIKELLSRLNHFNTHARTDALMGIKELATTHPEVLDQNLGPLILGITPLLLNIEKVVRHESLKALHTILCVINIVKIEPFFDIMSTYLRSAMTHIDSRIQEDSLLFLDLLLQCTPQKVAQDFHKILPNFLDMISKLRVDTKPGRTLTVNLGSQITTVKWRVKVLHRLKDYLQKFVDYKNVSKKDKSLDQTTYLFDNSKLNHFPLTDPIYTSVCNLSCFSSKNYQDTILLDEVEKLREYTDTLMPLLFETWLEVCPKTNTERNIETIISEDAASLLKHILDVLSLLWILVCNQNNRNYDSGLPNLFSQKYKKQFGQYFVNSFPFVTNVRTKKKSSNSTFDDEITDPKLILENLKICYLFIALNRNINLKSQNNEITTVLNYLEKTFSQNNHADVNNALINVLDTIFSNESNWTKNVTIMDPLFRKVIWAYFNTNMSDSFKQQIFTLLGKIALNDNLSHFHKCDSYEMWLKNLPDILLAESVQVQTIDIIHKFAIYNNLVFNRVIKSQLLKIVKNLPSIKISDSDDTNCYYKLFSILYSIKQWDSESLNVLEKQLIDNAYQGDYGKYIFDTLRLKTGGIL
ncbi:testis-expressed protein 10 homolog [Galleria mellonella]|uniref:Testis-expressed protein 10 homolog n=1 Tax=Galleria mellonella TaxID=7137 RepID=A0A6J1WG81_GALME|nr:testis-expressed protein 10 homolog [Galleria mellonella]